MAGLQVGGLGSGLDINSLVSQLVAAEGLNTQNRLDTREASIQSELSGLGFLKTAVADFQTALSGLKTMSAGATVSASSSDSTVFSATTVGDKAAPSTYSLEVQSLATNHKVSSGAFATTDTVIGTGKITFAYGTDSSPFVINADKTSQEVDLSGTDGSLASIRDAVNSADVDVTATIINDGTGYKLVFTSKDTGAENSLKITIDDDDGTDTNTSGLSQLAYDPDAAIGSGQNLTQTVAAADSVFVLDGATINTASNTLTDTIDGLSITLKKADLGNTHTLTVTESSSVGQSEVQTFIDAYNEFNTTLRTLSKVDEDTGEKGILFGDSTLRALLNRASSALAEPVPELESNYSSLAAIGVTTGDGGTLSLNSDLFTKATDAEPDIVARLFSNYGKTTDSNIKFVSATDSTSAGDYAINITSLATRGAVNGSAAPASLTITDGVNDTIEFIVDGVNAAIDIPAQTYASADALAATVQSLINSHASIQENNLSVTATVTGGVVSITSNTYGDDSTVTVVASGNGRYNLLGGAYTYATGADVVGTIGGAAATGDGQELTTSGGLKIQVLGTTTGNRGSVNYTSGTAVSLDSYFETILGTDGIVDSREESLNNQLERITLDREALFRRLERLETTLTAQFTNLDQLLTGFQSTSSYLTSALSSLPGAKSSSS